MRVYCQVVGCCLLLVLAGCSGFLLEDATSNPDREAPWNTTTTEATTAVETSTSVDSSNDERTNPKGLPVNVTRMYDRTDQLLGEDFDDPILLTENVSFESTYKIPPESDFANVIGVRATTTPRHHFVSGMATGHSISIQMSNRSTAADIRMLFVHEYAHVTNFQRESYRNSILEISRPNPRWRAGHAIAEGSATYVAQQYAERYGNVSQNQVSFCNQYEDGTATVRMRFGSYCVGARYIEDRIDDPANLDIVYENSPNTTEQVRHGYLPQEEPPVDLTVNATATDEWPRFHRARQGELWTYAALSEYLSDERADEAATGWGNDTLLWSDDIDQTGYVWVTRWDSTTDADEFAEAMRSYAANAATGNATSASFVIKRLDATTVVVLVGDDAFVNDTSVTVGEDGVHVRPP